MIDSVIMEESPVLNPALPPVRAFVQLSERVLQESSKPIERAFNVDSRLVGDDIPPINP